MKILLVNKFHYIKGGSETYYFHLGDLLRQQGHEVICFSMKDPRNRPCEQEPYFVENVDFNRPMSKPEMVRTGLKMLYSLEAKRKMERLIEQEKPDIAHLNIFQSQLTASVVDVLHRYRIPMVYTMHDLKPLCPCYTMMTHGELCEKCAGGNYLYCIQKRCMKDSLGKSMLAAAEAWVYRAKKTYDKFDCIITPSDFYKRKLEDAGVTRSKIVHMPNLLPNKGRCKQSTHRGAYFLYFGRLSREKGIFTLLEAYRKAMPDLPLYLVGTGPLEQAVKEKIGALSLGQQVRMLGHQQGEVLQDIISNSLCVILPSEWYENGPYAAIEALQHSRPLIAAQVGGIPELINRNGLTFPMGDTAALAQALLRIHRTDRKEYEALCKNSWQLYEQVYEAEKNVHRLLQLYERIKAPV